MILINNTEVIGWEHAIRGMRNPMNSWDKSDSCLICGDDQCCDVPHFVVGPNDCELMTKLANGGPVHGKFRRMIAVYVDITAPLYWWKEFDTHKVGTVANSCSTMHKIHEKRFEREDFSIEHLENCAYPKEGLNTNGETHWMVCMDNVIASLNVARQLFLDTNDKKYWWQMIQLIPSSYNQRRTIMANYEVLTGIYYSRKGHKLDEWRDLCNWIDQLPHSGIITGITPKEPKEEVCGNENY